MSENNSMFQTKWQIARDEKAIKVYHEYRELLRTRGGSKTAICYYLADKYKVCSISTIYKWKKLGAELMGDEKQTL